VVFVRAYDRPTWVRTERARIGQGLIHAARQGALYQHRTRKPLKIGMSPSHSHHVLGVEVAGLTPSKTGLGREQSPSTVAPVSPMPQPGDRSPGFMAEPSRCWAMVDDRNLQAKHCPEATSWTGRSFSPKGDRSWRVWSCPDHLEGLTGLRDGRRLDWLFAPLARASPWLLFSVEMWWPGCDRVPSFGSQPWP
jgi:hypothetical protein